MGMGAARTIKEEGKMPLSLGTGHLAFLIENCPFKMTVYFATIGWQSTSKHGIWYTKCSLVGGMPQPPPNGTYQSPWLRETLRTKDGSPEHFRLLSFSMKFLIIVSLVEFPLVM